MTINYIKDINDTDKAKVLLLIDASIQAYNAFSTDELAQCQTDKIVPPEGYDFVESWLGVDSIFGKEKTIECYGVVFRSQQAPYTYIFAFRGTASLMDVLDDMGADHSVFKPYDNTASVPAGVEVECGFYDVYTAADGDVPSMQQQVFQLIDKYQASDKPIDHLFITGHSLGAALCQLFTLDVALSRPSITASNINYASPRVGNSDFVRLYEQQSAQQNEKTRTLRVQNTYDKVPCVPIESIGYEHTSHAYIVAFYKDSWIGKWDFIDCHSSENYSAVLNCAAESKQGVCVCEDLDVPANGYKVTSKEPEVSTICSWW